MWYEIKVSYVRDTAYAMAIASYKEAPKNNSTMVSARIAISQRNPNTAHFLSLSLSPRFYPASPLRTLIPTLPHANRRTNERARLHAVTLLLLEMVLVGAEAGDPSQLSELYPLPLVAVTGGLGVWMAVRLVRDRGVDSLFVW